MRRAIAVFLAVSTAASLAAAQPQKPRLELAVSVTPTPVPAGSKAKATLRVTMPANVHVQSDKPKDATLIPTVLTLVPPAGVSVERIVYPAPATLTQAGRSVPLAVFGPELAIEVHLAIAPDATAGGVTLPGTLRYQACDDRVCFAPAKATTEWALTIEASRNHPTEANRPK